ncbi:MAG TPA: UDP-N-acetylglucosamine 1-carboxyvinyltransferase [Nitrospiria bacterium]|nr:UDP-N-acetylglucosamine 1-carboxyvinyltransferase [Nitrospiria bacterium]
MDKILIKGGKPLKGEAEVSGAKNAALPILAATLLSRGEHRIQNIPKLMDVATIKRLLNHLGAVIDDDGQGGWTVRMPALARHEAPYELVKTMRASVLVLGPLAARFGEARVSLPGGCAIGARPINLHLMGLEKMGAEIQIEHGYVTVKTRRLKGARIYLDLASVTGTENLMMAAALADGVTVIENAAREPEVVDLAHFLIRCGAKIQGAGTDVITIDGIDSLNDSCTYRIMADRIEAGTYLTAAAITGGDIFVRGCNPRHLDAVLQKLREAGVQIHEQTDGVRAAVKGRIGAVDVKTLPYPGFPTDMQAQIMALMALSDGLSVITETVFENRFTHVAELRRMGADINVQGNNAIIKGTRHLSGAPVMASDLRASASLVLAGLAAEGETEISRVYHLDRGYERIEQKFSNLGGEITRIKTP